MTAKRLSAIVLGVAVTVILTAASMASGSAGDAAGPIIIDHTCTDLNQVPDYWIEQAKGHLWVSYGHTSHGSQPISGMGVLMAEASYGGLYDLNTNGAVAPAVLSIADRTPSGDLGNPDRVTWEARTREYLDGLGGDRNVVIWSWCGQVSSATEADIDTYLTLMSGLERDYPDVTFVYLTGHLDSTGVIGNLNQRNNQIREFSIQNNKVLFDFADIESYDPDGTFFLDRAASDGCYYDSDGDGSRESNWADEWCAANVGDPLCAVCSCAHSRALNCNLKARAFWWMLARIAGWDGPTAGPPDLSPSFKAASSPFAVSGERITYTVAIRSASGPISKTIHVSDTLRDGLVYVPGSLAATGGLADDETAPTLTWSGVLTGSATPAVTLTYAATATYVTSGTATLALPQVISNTAVIAVPGSTTVTRTAIVRTNWLHVHLPLTIRNND
jgi:uncharacterized repeat protein (TIGR01451 family)